MRRTITDRSGPFIEARWWHAEEGRLVCDLCPHACVLNDGEVGICLVRENQGGILVSLNYGKVCAVQVDSIEKKPMFHFEPGAKLLSIGSFGCNLDCDFCQNSGLARPAGTVPCRSVAPSELVDEAVTKNVKGMAFTYNEPTVWAEFIVDVSRGAHENGLFIMLNTNGFIQGQAGEDVLATVDAIKVDIKGFSDDVYRKTNGGSLAPVMATCEAAKRLGVHLELSYLMIPTVTDRDEMLRDFGDWAVRSLGKDIPVHLFRFQPDHRMKDMGPESIEVMRVAIDLLQKSGLQHVYFGGMGEGPQRNTYCTKCGRLLIEREQEKSEPIIVQNERVSKFCPSFSQVRNFMQKDACPQCGTVSNVKYWHG